MSSKFLKKNKFILLFIHDGMCACVDQRETSVCGICVCVSQREIIVGGFGGDLH